MPKNENEELEGTDLQNTGSVEPDIDLDDDDDIDDLFDDDVDDDAVGVTSPYAAQRGAEGHKGEPAADDDDAIPADDDQEPA